MDEAICGVCLFFCNTTSAAESSQSSHTPSVGDVRLVCVHGVQIGCRVKLAMQIPPDRLTLRGQHVVCVEWFLGVQREKSSCQTSPAVVSFGLCRLVMMEEMSLRRGEEKKDVVARWCTSGTQRGLKPVTETRLSRVCDRFYDRT